MEQRRCTYCGPNSVHECPLTWYNTTAMGWTTSARADVISHVKPINDQCRFTALILTLGSMTEFSISTDPGLQLAQPLPQLLRTLHQVLLKPTLVGGGSSTAVPRHTPLLAAEPPLPHAATTTVLRSWRSSHSLPSVCLYCAQPPFSPAHAHER
jgi:hypothetical protein